MGVKVVGSTTNAGINGTTNPEVLDSTREQREVTVDGYTFHFGVNERKNFMDEGVGAAVARQNTATPQTEVEDTSMGSSRF